jgi:hypothetical protein
MYIFFLFHVMKERRKRMGSFAALVAMIFSGIARYDLFSCSASYDFFSLRC